MQRIALVTTLQVLLAAGPAAAQDVITPQPVPPSVPSPQTVTSVDESMLGSVGESCRARADCRTGLRCMNNVCHDEREGLSCAATPDCGGELRCIRNVCSLPWGNPTDRRGAGAGADDSGSDSEWFVYDRDGVHPFVGLAAMGGPAFWALTTDGYPGMNDRSVRGTFLFGIRGGLHIGRNELAVEISPMTFAYYEGTPGPTFQFNVSYARHISLYSSDKVDVSWPLRLGAGIMTGNTGDQVFVELRADLVGVAIRIGHFVIDLHLPSFRYELSPVRVGFLNSVSHFFHWLAGTSLSYAF